MLHSICQQIWKTQQWPQDWKRSVFIPISKKGNAKECSNYCTTALILHASKVMLKILQDRLQQYMNWELPDVQAGFRKWRGTRDHIVNIHWIKEKAREFQKNIYFCFIDYTNINQGYILSTCLFNLYTEYNMQNARLDEAQAGIKVAGRTYQKPQICRWHHLYGRKRRGTKSLLMKMKEECEKAGLKQHSKNEDHGICSHHLMTNRWGNNGNSDILYFGGGGLPNHCRWWLQP